MAVQIVTGIPRSGKTYFAVKHLAEKYFDRASDGTFHLKEKYELVKIVTNIDSLKLPHESLDEWIEKAGGVETLFSKDFQINVSKKYPQIVYVIDEAQFYFPSNFKENKVFNWFQWHGHLGQDIYLLTQNSKLLPFHIYALCETVLHAVPRSLSFTGGKELKYKLLSSGEAIGSKVTLKRQWVFDLYKSQDQKEVEKQKSPLLKFIFIPALLLFLAFAKNGFSLAPGARDRLAAAKEKEIQRGQNNVGSKSIVPVPASHLSNASARPGASQLTRSKSSIPRIHKLSYISENGNFLIFFDGQIIPASIFPFPIKTGPYNTLYTVLPSDFQFSDSRQEEPNQTPAPL